MTLVGFIKGTTECFSCYINEDCFAKLRSCEGVTRPETFQLAILLC